MLVDERRKIDATEPLRIAPGKVRHHKKQKAKKGWWEPNPSANRPPVGHSGDEWERGKCVVFIGR